MPKKQHNFTTLPDFPKLEEEVLSFWQQTKAFEQSVERRPADKSYVFYDGPPFATGLPHYGHLLASTTKDVIPRYQTMKGFRVERVWGWDCHGLPIENMIEQQLGIKGGKKGIEEMGIANFNAACRSEVMRLDTEWERIIGRLGRWVDFERNYKTMDATFMESVWWGFKQLYDKGLVYQGRKVILYCPRCATPLSNFEIAMDNSYKEVSEPSTTYKYALDGEENTYLLAWSTTPWNKLATPALAVNPDLTYVKVKQNDEFYILAETAVGRLKADAYTVVATYTGKELEQRTFQLHYDFFPERTPQEKAGVIVADSFVTADEGTGVVTLAIYGEDDYRVMLDRGIQLVEHVDAEGRLKPAVTPWAGLPILKANPLVDEDLAQRGLIYQHETHTHSVATCYRCGTRLYYAPLPAWFVDIKQMRGQLVELNEQINWFPAHLKEGRFRKGLENAPDWNISRSRYWGTPMPIWQSADGQARRVIGSRAELQEWAVEPERVAGLTDIHPEFLTEIEVWVDDQRTIKGQRISEVFDCWVESGSMPFAAIHYPFENKAKFELNYPAQFVSEYIAQTRAWFYTMHVISTGIFGQPPFENVLTTGTILAEDGSKMSKSKKNYPDPMILIDKYGVDSLRLYLMSSAVMKSENLNFAEKDVSDIRRKVFVTWWNVVAFYQQFANHEHDVRSVPAHPAHILDQWLLARLAELVVSVTKAFDTYDVVTASRKIISFVDELSTWYVRLSRERLKEADNHEVSWVFGHTLYTLAQLIAPLTPFFSEVIHRALVDEHTSIHHTDWPSEAGYAPHLNPALLAEMVQVKGWVEMAHAERKAAQLKVRQPLANLTVSLTTELTDAAQLAELMKQELNVKQITWQTSTTVSETSVALDTVLTPELIAGGKARDLMRDIQKLRKEQGLQPGQPATATLPDWPADWQAAIEQKTFTKLVKGESMTLQSE